MDEYKDLGPALRAGAVVSARLIYRHQKKKKCVEEKLLEKKKKV